MRATTRLLAALAAALLLNACSGLKTNSSGSSSTNSVTVTVAPTSISVVVSETTLFQAAVSGSTNSGVNWFVNGTAGGSATVGTINANGMYTAPATVPSPATVTVSAISQAETTASGSAAVQIVQANSNQAAQNTPVKLGASGGNVNDSSTANNVISCCSGTLGSLVSRNGIQYILSNNHVLARSDIAAIGDPISQPGLIDANCSTAGTTTVANLSQFVNLETSSQNVDAALAQVVSGAVDPAGNILSLGATATGNNADPGAPHAGNGILASVGESVAKSGRSSGLTCSTVAAISVTDTVSYQKGCGTGATFNVQYTNQISVAGGSFSTQGDSGSLIVDQNTADPVALLYGGSDTDAVGNPVADVLTALADQQGNKPTFVGTASTHRVIGCTLATNATKTEAAQLSSPTSAAIAQAEHARDLHAPEFLASPYIQGLGIAPSIDHPGEAAILFVVNPGQKSVAIPAEVEGIRTRIFQAGAVAPHGTFEYSVGAALAPALDSFAVSALSTAELDRAKGIHAAHVKDLIKQSGIQGVGITSSGDAPGEAALMIYLIRGTERAPVPEVIDGLRTRVRESGRFTAGMHKGAETPQGCRVPQANPASPIDSLPLPVLKDF